MTDRSTPRKKPHSESPGLASHRLPLAVIALAAALLVALTGCGSTTSTRVAIPDTAIGKQLAWVIAAVNGDKDSLAETEIERHMTSRALPATQFVEVARQAAAAYAPVRFTGFAGEPTHSAAIAFIKTRGGQKLAVYVSLERTAPHRITALDVTARPIAGLARTQPARRYTGAFPVGNGRKMFLSCSGAGTPTVILEAGAGGGVDSWFAVQPWLAATTRACSYDRANLPGGRSDAAPKPQTAANVVADLHNLLAAADVPRPYVLAGHSNGGLFARLYATTYPEQVKGLVLIDTGDYPAMLNALYRKMMPPSQWQAYQATLRHQPLFVESPADEQVDLATSYSQLAATQRRHPLPNLPFIVISHGIPDAPMGAEVVPGINKAIETEWQQMQIKLAHLVPGGKRIVATNSDHMIPTGQPSLVVRTIRAVLAQLAAGTQRR